MTGSRGKTAFSLDGQFFVALHERLEKERNSANEQHRLVFDGLLRSLNQQATGREYYFPEGIGVPYPPETVPTAEQLAHLIQTAFWASLEREEGRTLSFTISFMWPEPGSERLIAFAEPIPYRERELSKLAPAIGTGEAALLVAPFENVELKIWGVRDRSLAPVSLKAIDPGSIVVKFKEKNVAAISRSEALLIRDPLLTRSSVIWSRFASNGEKEKYDTWADFRVSAILQTVKRMRSLGHGGTLIIVPEESQWRTSVKAPIQYSGPVSFNPFRESVERLRELHKTLGHKWSDESYWWTTMAEACRDFARLTSVDGATIITYDLSVIGFGAKLQPSPGSAEPRDILNVDPLDHEGWFGPIKLEQLGATRHQSAARFISEQKDAIAFVVSQDGDVTAFVWYEPPAGYRPALYAYRRLELTLF